MPNSKGFTQVKIVKGEHNSGCSVMTNSVLLDNNRYYTGKSFDGFTVKGTLDKVETKGVQMAMKIDSTHFTKEDSLRILRNQLLEN
jgi:hypothetical protein